MSPTTTATAPVLLAHPDPAARAFLVDNFTADGIPTVVPTAVDEVLRLLGAAEPPAAIVLAVGGAQPTLDSTAVASHARAAGVPVLALVGPDAATPAGVADVLPTPFSYPELRSRLHSVLRGAARSGVLGVIVPADPRVPIGTIRVDDDLRCLQEIVGGDIETVPFPGRADVTPYYHADGKDTGRPANRRATRMLSESLRRDDYIAGDLLLVGDDGQGGLADLPNAAQLLAGEPGRTDWTVESFVQALVDGGSTNIA